MGKERRPGIPAGAPAAAIHPINPDVGTDEVRRRFVADSTVGDDAAAVYEIIRERALAAEAGPATFTEISCSWGVPDGPYRVVSSEAVIREPGWTAVLPIEEQDVEYERAPSTVPAPTHKLEVTVLECTPVPASGSSPGGFDPASLVEALENAYIARPGTYAHIVTELVMRGFVRVGADGYLVITPDGEQVLARLDAAGFSWVDANYCWSLHETSERVASGEISAGEAVAALLTPLGVSLEDDTCWIDGI